MTSRAALTALTIVTCFVIAACGGRSQNQRIGVVGSDQAGQSGNQPSVLSCVNGAGERIGESVFELANNGSIYRDGELKTSQDIFKRNGDEYTYELSWVSTLSDGTSRYDYIHHEREWLYNPDNSGEAFLAAERFSYDNSVDVLTYFEEGVTGTSIERCGVSAMTDRNFLSCTESGTNTGATIAKRSMAHYDAAANLLSIDNFARDLRPRDDSSNDEQLTDLGEGWLRYERQTTQPSFTGEENFITRQTMEFNSWTGMVRSFESRNSPTPYLVSCR